MKGYWLDLGYIPYAPAFTIQEGLFVARLDGFLPPTIIVQENPPVFTIGRSGSMANILAAPEELERMGIEVIEVNRGGDVTYHGPGQIIASPLFYLGDVNLNANQYLHRLEDLLIDVLAGYGISGSKDPDYPGVWLGVEKIAAVGIAVKHGYTWHGFSLNVNLDLAPFRLINPCGVPHMPVTSIERVLGHKVSYENAKQQVRQKLSSIFSLELEDITWNQIQAMPGVSPDPAD